MRMRMNARASQAFARVDLLVLLAGALLLAFVLAPAHARSLSNSHLAVCMSNLRQLTQAWQMFAEAHDGVLPRNVSNETTPSPAVPVNIPWARGWLSWDYSPDNTNMLNVTQHALGPYVNRNPRVFKCPSDVFVSAPQRRFNVERVRSYSMNGFVGRSRAQAVFGAAWNHYDKLQDLRDL